MNVAIAAVERGRRGEKMEIRLSFVFRGVPFEPVLRYFG